MKKKIKELTDQEICKYVYQEDDGLVGRFTEYKDREDFTKDETKPAKTIRYDNCRYCKNVENLLCNSVCENFDTSKEIIDFNAIREGIYKDDELEVEDNE